MLKSGFICESDERPDPDLDDQRRRYYGLTELGRKVLLAESQRLVNQVAVVQRKNVFESAG
jgi:hypothetical protein